MNSSPAGIVVTGPPRSGTSATTRLINLAGARLCVPRDLVGGGPNNPTGHWESKTVLAINNQLHEAAGTRWWCPLPPGTSAIGPDVDDARARFRAVHPDRPWVCKDPRFTFTLPYWRHALGETMVVAILVRRPDEVVSSMRRTWPLSIEHACALWTRYLYAAIAVSEGCPTVMVRFPEVLAAPDALALDLSDRGTQLERVTDTAANSFLRQPMGIAGNELLPAYAWDVWNEVSSLATERTPFVLRPEPSEVEDVLGARREELRAGRPLDMRPVFTTARSEG